MSRNIRYLESAISDAKREGLVAVENAFVVGTLLQAKIQNDVELLHDLEPTVMTIIGAKTPVPA